jgi:hypothetical protein
MTSARAPCTCHTQQAIRHAAAEPTIALMISWALLSWSIIVSWYGLCHRPDWPRLSGLVWVGKCMCVVFTETKKDLLALVCRRIKSTARLVTSSSIVTIRAMQGLDCGRRRRSVSDQRTKPLARRLDCKASDRDDPTIALASASSRALETLLPPIPERRWPR